MLLNHLTQGLYEYTLALYNAVLCAVGQYINIFVLYIHAHTLPTAYGEMCKMMRELVPVLYLQCQTKYSLYMYTTRDCWPAKETLSVDEVIDSHRHTMSCLHLSLTFSYIDCMYVPTSIIIYSPLHKLFITLADINAHAFAASREKAWPLRECLVGIMDEAVAIEQQLDELDLLQSVFSQPGEYTTDDQTVLERAMARVKRLTDQPPVGRLSCSLHLLVDVHSRDDDGEGVGSDTTSPGPTATQCSVDISMRLPHW